MLWTAAVCLLWGASWTTGAHPGHKVLLVSFDGFRWDYDRDVDTPNLDRMARDGVKADYVTPPYLTITSPTHFTLLTGRYIENHGVIHNMWFNTSSMEKKPYYQTQFVNEWWDNGTLPIWITAQKQGLKSGSLHFPGTASSYQGQTAMVREVEPLLYNYKNETAWRQNADKVMGWFRDQDLDFVSLYFGEPDGTGHRYGPDSPQRRDMVRQVDRTVGYIRQSAENHGLSDVLNVIITSDHGMTAVYRNGLVEEITLSAISGFSFRDVSFHLVDFGPSGMLLPKPGKLEKVYRALKGAHPHLHVYKKEEMPEHLHFANNQRILPIILLADAGYVINGYFPVQFNKGEHGFDNHEMDMKAFFRAAGPAFRKDLKVGPFETVHIYPLMCHILGIRPEVNDGRLDATRDMLVSHAREKDEGKRANSVVNAVTGLAATAGFLLVLFVMIVTHKMVTDRRRGRSGAFTNAANDTQQISF
ncbi:ectonucleotide pyrophosphatase/phosphodiesterase family member 7-like isoform X1 [Phyllopteryx taeniolatus]|uniref:ectonucleotide pyrophosphatase/phosphodiesterase family member 7-like isoform X1 n=1 Tax=Phyllopteryx taeniolatus TaxID=161469 RepID=UPI002AD58D76|nr:ectonucleotide pyrophosphatase/phosphodiesterase family member 7-like isoform X1 [Phyllopteryx taeniolatus]